MFLKHKKHKTFDYTPQFYDPDKDLDLRERLKFTSHRKKSRAKSGNLIKLLILFAIIVFLYLYLSGKI
ncbi:MAG: hypothetical protein KAR38_14335 [Calditrichia bacterium]|nr:hypothetical protein [Calditrichia bacterium]